MACHQGFHQLVETLIAHKADVDAKNDAGLVPLLVACKRNAYPCIPILVAAGAQKDCVTPKGEPSVYLAGADNNIEAMHALFDAGCDLNALAMPGRVSVLQTACCNGWLEQLEFLLKRGIDPDLATIHGEVPLINTAKYGYVGFSVCGIFLP